MAAALSESSEEEDSDDSASNHSGEMASGPSGAQDGAHKCFVTKNQIKNHLTYLKQYQK